MLWGRAGSLRLSRRFWGTRLSLLSRKHGGGSDFRLNRVDRLAEFFLELAGRTLKPLQGASECLAQLGQALRAEHQKTDGRDDRQLRQSDSEDVHPISRRRSS